METYWRPFLLFVLLLALGVLSVSAHPKVIKGTVYRDGKPASGVHVTVDKSKDSYFTSFDGKYELKANLKSKWIKFTFPDKEEKLDVDLNRGDIIDFGAPAKNTVSEKTNQGKR